jgi:hypothetical protein
LLDETQVPLDRSFFATDIRGSQSFDLELSWVSINELDNLVVYPGNAGELLRDLLEDPRSGVRHLVYRETGR